MAAATGPAATAEETKTFYDEFKKYILMPVDTALLKSAPEMGHLAPVILTMGTAFMALISMNWPMAVFSASSVEAHFLYNATKLLSDFFVTPTLGVSAKPETESQKTSCRSYFQTLTPSRFRWLMEEGLKTTFPNQALFFISFAASYCLESMLFFSKEVSELGPQYSNRPYLGIIGAGMFIALFAIYLLMYGCDSIFTIFFSILAGLLVGVLVCYQNYLLFGKESVNLLFIPPLAQRKGMDYLCVSKTSSV
jgi:hypothetical protein